MFLTRLKLLTITKAQVQEIAETKMPDLNAANLEAAMSNDRWYSTQHGCYCRRVKSEE